MQLRLCYLLRGKDLISLKLVTCGVPNEARFSLVDGSSQLFVKNSHLLQMDGSHVTHFFVQCLLLVVLLDRYRSSVSFLLPLVLFVNPVDFLFEYIWVKDEQVLSFFFIFVVYVNSWHIVDEAFRLSQVLRMPEYLLRRHIAI